MKMGRLVNPIMAVVKGGAILGVCAIGATTFVPDSLLTPGERTAALASLAAGPRPFTGLYLGISQDGAAWLVRLDSSPQLALLYDPLESIALCEVKVDSSDHIWFRSAEIDGSTIRFAGLLSRDGFTGMVSRLSVRTGAATDSFPLAFHKIRARFLAGMPDPISGVYVNLRGTPSGDIYGRKLVLIDAVDGLVALDIVYEGTPGVPRAALKAERAGHMVNFLWSVDTTQVIEHPASDTAIIRGKTLEFWSGQMLVRGETRSFHSYKMVKKLTLQEAFRRTRRADCP